MPEYSVGVTSDYAEGTRKVMICGDKEIGIFKVGGEFYAWHNRCAHRAGPVCQGRIMKKVLEPVDPEGHVRTLEYDENELHIICPWHGYEFNIRTGQHPGNPKVRLLKADVIVRDKEVYVRL